MYRKFLGFALSLLGFGADVITVATGTAGNAGNVAADLQTYFAAKLLEVAEFNTILDQFGEKTPIPSNSSKTIHFVREEKFADSATPTQLTEGVAPDAVGLTLNQFEAVAEQYGFLTRISDLAELTAKHPIIQKTIYLLGLNAAEMYDQLIYNVLNAATQTYYPSNLTADTSLTASNQLGYADLVEIEASLAANGARPFDGGEYVAVLSPQVYAAIQKDPDWKAAHQLVQPEAIYRGEVGVLSGLRVVRSNSPSFAGTTQTGTGQATPVYTSFVIARFAYQIADLQNLRVNVVAPGGQSDPLQQNRKIGYKFAFKAIITNPNWLFRVRTPGVNSINHA